MFNIQQFGNSTHFQNTEYNKTK